MTTTPATQAILPVTQTDREAAAQWLRSVHSVYLALWIEGEGQAPEWAESSNPDNYSLVQAFARHRKAHSLPGDVGMLDDKGRDHLAGEILGDQMSDEELQSWADCRLTTISLGKALKAVRAALDRAALTPSALSGDAP